MIDFGSLVGKQVTTTDYDLLKLYSTLDVKSTHTEPRTSQKEAMQELTKLHASRDLVLKISTGAGKTTVGLLYLLGHMRKSKRPAVYLCPTNQLVEQVLLEASRLGVQAHHYQGGNPFPDPTCMRGDAVLVCTYEKLFNYRTTFMRSDVNLMPVAIVLDDAHAGAEIVRKQFTLQLTGDAYEELKEIIAGQCRSFHSTRWRDIEGDDPSALFEVPHWIWADLCSEIREKLHSHSDSKVFGFVWPFLESRLSLCRCVLSSSRAEISPEIIPVEMLRPYNNADHRLFMSATLADDSLLVRDMAVEPEAALKPISPPSDRGLGERMILAPALVSPDLDRNYLMQLCSELSKKYNVVVLTSSETASREWESCGATYFNGDEFSEAVRKLKNPSSGVRFAVFAQRYDGVDLADDACRVLVIDGVPHGENLVDKYESQMVLSPGGVRNKTIFRIEQGMGRAVRSHADYALVLLVGQDLATFIGRAEVLAAMTDETRAQLDLSVEIAELLKTSSSEPKLALEQVVNQCLSRDQGWKSFYNSRIRSSTKEPARPSSLRVELANKERQAYNLAASNRAVEAMPIYRSALNDAGISGEELGIYLQRLARVAYSIDPPEAMRIQQAARSYCLTVALPPAVARPIKESNTKTTADRLCAWLREFSNLNAAVIEAAKLTNSFDFSEKPRRIEKAVMDLGRALGAISTRPENEFNEGPDNLWVWGNHLFVIEVKSENMRSLHKSDSGQLHDSLKWARDNYPEFSERLVPVTVCKVTAIDSDAHYPENTRLLLDSACKDLAVGLHRLCLRFAQEGPVFVTPDNVLKAAQEFALTPEQLISTHSIKV